MNPADVAREFGPILRERADEIEAARRLPEDLARQFAEAGLCRMLVPESVGGWEVSPSEMLAAIETLAEADGSAAWCVFIYATTGSLLAYLPTADAKEVFSSPDTILAGVFAPSGEARVESDSFRVNGRWSWGSGTQNADWVLGGCRVVRDGEVEAAPNGAPLPRQLLAPASDIRFFDTWNVSGLCGTGSTDFAMEDVRVPLGRSASVFLDRPVERPLYQFPNFALLALGIAGVAAGLARAAIEELIAMAAGKTPQGSSRSLANRPHTQAELAQAEAGLRSARAFLQDAVETAWDVASRTGEIPVEQKRDLRLATTWTTRSAAQTVDRMYELGGGTSIHRSQRLQRLFRDVHVATQHMMVSPQTYELTGRLLLGLPTDTTFL